MGIAGVNLHKVQQFAQLAVGFGAQVLVAQQEKVLDLASLRGPQVEVIAHRVNAAAVITGDKVEQADLGASRRVVVDGHLGGLDTELPLEELRYRHVSRVAGQQYHALVVEGLLGLEVAGEILDVVIVGEEYPWHRAVQVVEVVESKNGVVGQAVHHPEQVRHHNPQPGAAALAKADHHDIRPAQLVVLFDAAQLALGLENLRLRLAAHAPVEDATRQFLVGGLQCLAQVLNRKPHAADSCCET